MMRRASIIYVLVAVACAWGLWWVLARGGRLRAPEDLAGRWTLSRAAAPAEPAMPMAPYGPAMTIDQSGQFFQVSFENGPRLDLKLHEQTEFTVGKNRSFRLELVGAEWNLRGWTTAGSDEMVVHLVGPARDKSGRWTARRLVRTFAADSPSKGGH